MPDLELVRRWMDGYVRAWESNDPAEIGGLFTEDATYATEPFNPAWRGREAIVAAWLERKDEPGAAVFVWEPLAVTDEVAVVQGRTDYRRPLQTYSNLWVIRLDAEGRCREFTEWWMRHPDEDQPSH